ncbi:hypothetical protein COLO4_22369 [Corchorus olitorius]|uniref:Sugar phosphate transporter domain-containing protein n=1 Tax=Corchorus olitorius TaxID=93759 RepID=A0A1R3IMA9_9ROSI|nr:hypothetical protein COLO4_22369 [Corchorus olitorius]
MSSVSKADRKAALDVASWFFNVVTSVGIIMVNKALMGTYGFSFATTLTGLHFATTTLLTVLLRWLGYIQGSQLPLPELLKFVLFANFSIVGMNVSLMWNSVGFYQIAKLSMIPVSCFLEVVFDKVRYSRDTKLSILVVLLGVAVCTVTDVSVNFKGFLAAVIAVWSTALQQYYVHFLQRKHSLGSFDLLGHTAPVQAASLLLCGPFVDYWLTEKKVYAYDFTVISMLTGMSDLQPKKEERKTNLMALWLLSSSYLKYFHNVLDESSAFCLTSLNPECMREQHYSPNVEWSKQSPIPSCRPNSPDILSYAVFKMEDHGYKFFLVLSCSIAVGTNLSQFICIGRFTAVSFQVLGHMKTILVLMLGFIFFGKEGLNLQVILGMVIAVAGMVWYGNASSKPGGKERRIYPVLSNKSQKQEDLSDSTETDEKV